jgi:hypothetical protein
MSIQEYIEEHALGKRIEDTINAAVKAKATEPVSFMVRDTKTLPRNARWGRSRIDARNTREPREPRGCGLQRC